MRARLVSGRTLTEVAAKLNLGKQLVLGQGEMNSGGIRRSSILADALEAVFGAILLDGGLAASQKVIAKIFYPLIDELPSAEMLKDAKTRLQEWLQARGRALPVYRLIREEGADHAKRFHVACELDDGSDPLVAVAQSRRQAEQLAAAEIMQRLEAQGKSK
jgi:ribonuclease-3